MLFAMVKIVTPGQKCEARLRAGDPGVHLLKKTMDGRVKPGHDC
jgi:hypothetical protein